MEKSDLAIVIPAYKIDFFDSALKSLSDQTNKNFTVYIGIDASKADFESVIDKYKYSVSIIYQRFDENLGGKDLVAQWNRCLNLIKEEQWIWLFSDDDMMEADCIEKFYNEIRNGANYDLYHFDVDIINERNEVIKKTKAFPTVIDGVSFLKKKNSAVLDSFVVEYIFRRSTFIRLGGFQYFDLAWGTDIATWAKIGKEKGIKTIPGVKVFWRQSSLNITPKVDKERLIRKLKAHVCFYIWCKKNYDEISFSDIYYYMFRMLFHYSPYLKVRDFKSIVNQYFSMSKIGILWYRTIIFSYPLIRIIYKIKHLDKNQ